MRSQVALGKKAAVPSSLIPAPDELAGWNVGEVKHLVQCPTCLAKSQACAVVFLLHPRLDIPTIAPLLFQMLENNVIHHYFQCISKYMCIAYMGPIKGEGHENNRNSMDTENKKIIHLSSGMGSEVSVPMQKVSIFHVIWP